MDMQRGRVTSSPGWAYMTCEEQATSLTSDLPKATASLLLVFELADVHCVTNVTHHAQEVLGYVKYLSRW
jgi:hypothetical protein